MSGQALTSGWGHRAPERSRPWWWTGRPCWVVGPWLWTRRSSRGLPPSASCYSPTDCWKSGIKIQKYFNSLYSPSVVSRSVTGCALMRLKTETSSGSCPKVKRIRSELVILVRKMEIWSKIWWSLRQTNSLYFSHFIQPHCNKYTKLGHFSFFCKIECASGREKLFVFPDITELPTESPHICYCNESSGSLNAARGCGSQTYPKASMT